VLHDDALDVLGEDVEIEALEVLPLEQAVRSTKSKEKERRP
jgi:hypothetical protein